MKRLLKNIQKPMLIALVLIILLTFSPVLVQAKSHDVSDNQESITYEETFTVTEKGGNFKIGFVKVQFKKDFLEDEYLPLVIGIQLYAENGLVYIDFSPDVIEFKKDIKIKTATFKGYIYDKAKGENIYVELPSQTFYVSHFSRYCFIF